MHILYPERLDADSFEASIITLGSQINLKSNILIDYRQVKFAPLDVIASSIFFYNELSSLGSTVTLQWNEDQEIFQYIDRMGFFNILDKNVKTIPPRPIHLSSRFNIHRKRNPYLLEITEISITDKNEADKTLKRLLSNLESNLSNIGSSKRDLLVNRIWTFSAEALGNIFEHSQSKVPGIIAAQRYESKERGARLHLVIADGGLGISNTIRAGLPSETQGKKDSQIIFTAFKEGLSRKLGSGGCGLKTCAEIAMHYQANLRVRVGRTWVKLITKSAKTGITLGVYSDEAFPIKGTQISFDFYLDRLQEVA